MATAIATGSREKNSMNKPFEEPTIESYDRDELAAETVFTGGVCK